MSIFTKTKTVNPKYMMDEGPTVIGMMSVIIESGGSLDTAVRDVVKNGPRRTAKFFGAIVCDADTRVTPDIKAGLSAAISSLPETLASFRRSMHMVVAASESKDRIERGRMLKDASDIALAGLKEAGETYSSALNTPCMVVFGLGIMIPMILMSILPMLSISGMFGSAAFDPKIISIITLLGIPAVIVSVILSIKEKNPFMVHSNEKMDLRYVLPFFVSLPVGFFIWNSSSDIIFTVVIALSAGGLATFAVIFPEVNKEKIRAKREKYLKDSIFELGNMLIAGDNFDNALTASIGVRKECIPIAESVKRELVLSRGDYESAIKISIEPISPFVAGLLCDIYSCSRKDIRDAGRLALSIGRQLQDQETVRKGIGNKLKSMVDMMTGTAMIFAPLVLGMSVSMLKPLAGIMEGADATGTSSVLTIYLAELCVMMSFLTAYLTGRAEPKGIIYNIAMMLPVALITFYVCTTISF